MKRCLPDTFRNYCFPNELLRFNLDTAPLERVDKFVHRDFDRPENQKLLDLLGVRSKPDNADALVGRIRALSELDQPPIRELVNLYEALDRVMTRLDKPAIDQLQNVFATNKLIRSEGGWEQSGGIFQGNDEDIPGVAVVIKNASSLPLWDRLGVRKQPTLEMAIEWLSQIESGTHLEGADRDRARVLSRRAPRMVWDRCEHWLNLSGVWTATNLFRWAYMGKESLQLFPSVKLVTADFSRLSTEDIERPPFSELPRLDQALEYVVQSDRTSEDAVPSPEWLTELALCLMRVQLTSGGKSDDESDQAKLRRTAERLACTSWKPLDTLQVVPFLDGEAAGDAFSLKVVWHEDILYITNPGPSSHRDLVTAIAQPFDSANIREAIAHCVAHDPQWIESYFRENFILGPADATTKEADSENGDHDSSLERLGIGEDREGSGESANGLDKVDEQEVDDTTDKRDAIFQFRRTPTRLKRERQFFARLGFHWDSVQRCFIAPGGSQVRHCDGVFRWARYDANGIEEGRYWFGDKSLHKGVEIPSELWEALKSDPDHSWLVLPDEEDTPLGYSGRQLDQYPQGRLHDRIFRHGPVASNRRWFSAIIRLDQEQTTAYHKKLIEVALPMRPC